MFEPASRYYSIETTSRLMPDGTIVAYKRRRFLPNGDDMRVLTEVPAAQGDRIDSIAARTLGDPEQFWRICDANNAMDPAELTGVPGRRLRIPIPQL